MRDQDFISLTSKRGAKRARKFYNRKKHVKEREKGIVTLTKKEGKTRIIDIVINKIIIIYRLFLTTIVLVIIARLLLLRYYYYCDYSTNIITITFARAGHYHHHHHLRLFFRV